MTSTATANPVLRGFYNKFMRDEAGFVAELLAPTFNTGEQSAQYYVFDAENLLHIPRKIERAPGAEHVEVNTKLSDDNYNCKNYGLKIPVADEERKKYAIALDADLAAIKRVTDIIKVNRELRVKAKATNAAVVPNASPAIKWNDVGCNPKNDVDAGKEAIRKGIGLRANTMVISETVKLILENHPEIRKAFQLTIEGRLTVEMLQVYFNIPRIAVAGTVLATSAEGQQIASDDIWQDDIVLAHVEPGQDLMLPNFMRSMNWSGVGSIEGALYSFRNDDRKADMHAIDHSTDEKVTGTKAAYLLTDVLG